MHRAGFLASIAAVVLSVGDSRVALGQAQEGPALPKVELALHYDLYAIQDGHIHDASGQQHHGKLQQGEIIFGRNKPAVSFRGEGSIAMSELPETLNPASRSFTVGALCRPQVADAVLLAMGDDKNGFCLFLKGGVPHFGVRSDGELTLVAASDPVELNQWVHLAGAIDANGRVHVLKNGWSVANMTGSLIAHKPDGPFAVASGGSLAVADAAPTAGWQGLLQDVRLYWGVLDRATFRDDWQEWADIVSCGCRG